MVLMSTEASGLRPPRANRSARQAEPQGVSQRRRDERPVGDGIAERHADLDRIRTPPFEALQDGTQLWKRRMAGHHERHHR